MYNPPWRSRPRRVKPPPAPPPPLPQEMVDEFRSRPFAGSSYGEFLVPRTPEPSTPGRDARLPIPPPPWADDPMAAKLAPPTETHVDTGPPALGEYDPAPFRPIVNDFVPLLPPKIPPPDWREEERQRLAQQAAELEPEQDPARPTYPARRSA